MTAAATAWLLEHDEMEGLQRRAAGALAARGLRAGDRVALAVPNSPELLAVVLGALRTGVVPVLLHATLRPAEVDALVADAEPSLSVRDPAALAPLVEGPEAELAPFPLARPMHYTSGTSGTPKGVWTGVLSEDDARGLFEDEADLWGYDAGDTHVVCSPLSHSVNVRFSAGALLRGGRVLLFERFDAEGVAGALASPVPTTAFVVPTHLQRMFAAGAVAPGPNLRLLVHAGEACPEPLKRRALDAFRPGSVWEFYGATEGQFTVCPPDEWLEHPGTVGRARPGRRLSTDADGVVWCEAPAFARFEYWRRPEATAAAWRGSAFTAGDLGRLDGDGHLFLDGRRDDLVISGGVNVYPAEVEGVLARFPGVEEVAVFGAPDPDWGRRVCAAVIGEVDPDALVEHARSHLAGHKRPKAVYVVDDLPRTPTGKVRRSAIAAALGLDG